MSLYTAPPSSGGSSSGSGLASVGLTVSPASVLTVSNSPITVLSEDSNISLVMTPASASGNGYITSGDYTTFAAGVPAWDVMRVRGTTRTYYAATGNSDTARGQILIDALATQQIGDIFYIGSGVFQHTSSVAPQYLATGITLIGVNRFATILRMDINPSTQAFIATSGCVLKNLMIDTTASAGAGRIALGIIGYGTVEDVNLYSQQSRALSIDFSTSNQPTTFLNRVRATGSLYTGRNKNIEIWNSSFACNTSANPEETISLGNSTVLNSYYSRYIQQNAGVPVLKQSSSDTPFTANFYGDIFDQRVGGTSVGAISINSAAHRVGLFNAQVFSNAGPALFANGAGLIRLFNTSVSGATYAVANNGGTILSLGGSTFIGPTSGTQQTYGTSAHTIMPPASSNVNGYLSSGDWASFTSGYKARTISYGELIFPNAIYLSFNSGNIPTGVAATTILTVPADRKYIITDCNVYSVGVNTAVIFEESVVNATIGAVSGQDNRPIHYIFSPGEAIKIRGVAINPSSPYYTATTSINVSMDIISVPSSINLKTITGNMVPGTGTLYTCPANTVASFFRKETGDPSMLLNAVDSQTTRIHIVPSGGNASMNTVVRSIDCLANTWTSNMRPVIMGGALRGGDTIRVAYTGGSSVQVWANIIERPA